MYGIRARTQKVIGDTGCRVQLLADFNKNTVNVTVGYVATPGGWEDLDPLDPATNGGGRRSKEPVPHAEFRQNLTDELQAGLREFLNKHSGKDPVLEDHSDKSHVTYKFEKLDLSNEDALSGMKAKIAEILQGYETTIEQVGRKNQDILFSKSR